MNEFRVERRAAGVLAVRRIVIQNRKELATELNRLVTAIPAELISGPPQCAFQFISSVTVGHEVELRVPLRERRDGLAVELREQAAFDLLVLCHRGPAAELGGSYGRVFSEAGARGLISDEYLLESYPEGFDPEGGTIEVGFVIHNWPDLFRAGADRVLGQKANSVLWAGLPQLDHESRPPQRFEYTCQLLERLEDVADEEQQYEIVSRCSHVFPVTQTRKLRDAFLQCLEETGRPLEAVDAVIAFMEADAGWAEAPVREGGVILSRKKPCDPKAYEAATMDAERRRAYCFCPLIRDRLHEEIPANFCHCGAGWFRQQWEAALDRPVRVRTLRTVRAGDDECCFAVDLPTEWMDGLAQ